MKLLWILTFFGVLAAGELLALENPNPAALKSADPYQWLEEVTGEKALAWARERNAESGRELAASPEFQKMEADILEVLDSRDRIPAISKRGSYFYNFWKDAEHPRGIWRRTTLEEYRKAQPKWELILDLDALAKAEKENWVWSGVEILKAGGYRHCLISLSRGGADATVVREFDLQTRSFVTGGFQLPEAKGGINWIDKDSVYVSTDFGPGTMTTSGYPRLVKLWKRGTPLSGASLIYEAKNEDMSVAGYFDDTEGFERHFIRRELAFYNNELFLRRKDGSLQKVDKPNDAEASVFREWLLVQPRTPWTVGGVTHPAGSLLAARFDDFMSGKRQFSVLFAPTANASLASHSWTRGHLLLNVMEDVKNRLLVLTPGAGDWTRQPLPGSPAFATASIRGVDPDESDDYFMTVSGYLAPESLYYGKVGSAPEKLKETPSFFDAARLEVSQHFSASKDGTRIPYFQISPKGMKLDGSNPTLLYGYGGFEISMTPAYSGGIGRVWLSRGGVYVVANIRGGGEYGPKWHQAALKQNRLRAYEDFAAVAADLVARKVTSPKRLGTQGGSNGGLLMGNMITLYPQMFGAVVCQVPLLDMQRYSHLLAGASWMAEYGDPDKPEEWAFIRNFSPYHNLQKGKTYPPVLFTTSTRDDRVHPGHARKMMARMRDMGLDVRYYENIEGGHGGAANNRQRAHMSALAYTFLWQKLKQP